MIKIVEVYSNYIIGGNTGLYTILRSDKDDKVTSLTMEVHELVQLGELIEKELTRVKNIQLERERKSVYKTE